MMLNLITKRNTIYVDSRQIAKMIGKKHFHLIRDIDGYIELLTNPSLEALSKSHSSKVRNRKQLNTLTASNLRTLKKYQSSIKVEDFFIKSSYKDSKGEHRPHYLITKLGCDFIANKMTGIKGVLFTANYVKQFHNMYMLLIEKDTEVWQIERAKGKEKSKELGDAVKPFVEYAIAQGSKHAKHYYTNFNNLINDFASVSSRDNCDLNQLEAVNTAINIVVACINEGIKNNVPYKKIFKDCKNRLTIAKNWGLIAA